MESALIGYFNEEPMPERERLPRLPPRPRGPSPKKPTAPAQGESSEPLLSSETANAMASPPTAENANPAVIKKSSSVSRPRRVVAPAAQEIAHVAVEMRPAITRRQTRERFPDPQETAPTAPGLPAIAGLAPEPTGDPPRRATLRSKIAVEAPTRPLADGKSTTPATRRKRVSFDADVSEQTLDTIETTDMTPAPTAQPAAMPATKTKAPATKRKRASTVSAAAPPKAPKSPKVTKAGEAAQTTATPKGASPIRVPAAVSQASTPQTPKTPSTSRSARRRTSAPATPLVTTVPVQDAYLSAIIAAKAAKRWATLESPSGPPPSSQPGAQASSQPEPEASPLAPARVVPAA